MYYSMTIWYDPNHSEWFDAGILEHLKQIKFAGFTHINWNPDAGSSYLYSRAEMDHIKEMIDSCGLKVKSFHASHGQHHVMEIASPFQDRRKDITSNKSWRQQAGIELVENRLIMANVLECDNIVLHIPFSNKSQNNSSHNKSFMQNVFKALDLIRPMAEREGICIAVENLHSSIGETTYLLESLFNRYPKDFIGWCYDSGHAQNIGLEYDALDKWKDRMIATHLHDNGGAMDDHLLPGDGKIDWDKVANIIAESAYELPLNYETPFDRYSVNSKGFYDRAYKSIVSLTKRVEEIRSR